MVRRVLPRRRAARRSVVATVVAALLVASAGCAAASGSASPTAPDGSALGAGTGGQGSAGTTDGTASPGGTVPTTPFLATTTAPVGPLRAAEPGTCAFPISVTQTAPAGPTPASAPPPGPDGTTPPPVDARSALDRFRADPRVAGSTRSVSVWIDGVGEAAAENPDRPMIPASNQKLLTALAVLRLLPPDERLHTDLVATGPVVDGVLHGDLVLVGGGDPTLARTGDHSLEALAASVGASGIHAIEGHLLVDDTRYDDQRSVAGWSADWPRWIGSLSALAADHNQYRKDDAFLRDPAQGNGELLAFALRAAGVDVPGAVAHGAAPAGVRVASVASPTFTELVTLMLFRSDNFIAEMLLKELGHRRTGTAGTTAGGLAAVHDVVATLCPQGGVGAGSEGTGAVDVDGSGFSGDDRHSARELRRLLLAAQLQPWGSAFVGTLPVAGQPEALGGRLDGPRTAGNVRAKGGSLSTAKSLSGFLTTASGRNVVFSIIVNGGNLAKAEDAIDDFVTNLASLRI